MESYQNFILFTVFMQTSAHWIWPSCTGIVPKLPKN